MIYKILLAQQKVQNIEFTKLVLINSITIYLLNKNKTNFIALLKPLGTILNTFHVQITSSDLNPLKRKFETNDILFKLAEIIINANGYKNNLIPLLKMLVTYENIK